MTERSLFAAALDIPDPAARAAFLDRACAADPALRQHLDGLLAAQDQLGSFLARPVATPTTDYEPPIPEGEGTVIGPYTLREQIGEGGFGLVFVAEQQQPIRRKVALKVIKPGMDTRQVVARFEAERQALALMDHPNIARVLDAGATDSGRPYFVMELVKGVPITEYADANHLTPKDRLGLFIQVCQAVQHAHQKGVIHRDLKPSNILVAPHDGIPVVKVIDFGVAKALGQSLTDKTIYTRFAQMIGTPLYMSPEQAEVNQLDVDTRSDIYSLGVLLYELLTGTTPFDGDRFRKAAFDEIRRIIKEEDPPRPSTRLTSLGETLTAVSARRGTDPGRLAGLVRGELDWIVMKCLEKDRSRRYDSAAGLAKDVQRHLAGDAVEACPPSLGYRLRKFGRRNSAAIIIVTVFVLTLKATTLFSLWQVKRATVAELIAETERDEAARQRDAALAAEEAADRERAGAVAARDNLRHALYATDLQTAASLWQAKDRRRTLEELDRQRPRAGETDLRGFEWHFLNRECRGAARTLPLPAGIKRFTPDGRRVYVVQRADQRKDGRPGTTVRGWDLNTGQELPEWEPFPGRDVTFLSTAGFSRTGGRALVGYSIGTPEPGQPRQIKYAVFDLESRKELFTLGDRPAVQLHTPALDREGRLLAVHYTDENVRPEPTVTIWNVDERKVARTITVDAAKGEMFAGAGRAFHPNGKQLAAIIHAPGTDSSNINQLRVWDVDSGTEVWRRPVERGTIVPTLAYSPDGRYLADSSGEADVIYLRKPDGGQIVHTLRIPDMSKGRTAKILSFSPDGSRLGVSLAEQSGAHVWEIPARPSGPDLLPIRSILSDAQASRVTFTPEGRSVLVTSSATTDVAYYDLGNRAVALSGPDAIRSPFTSGPASVRRPVVVGGPDGGRRPAYALWKVESPGPPKVEVRAWDVAGREVFRVQCDSLEDWYSGWNSPDGKRFILIQSSTHRTDPALDRSRVQVWDFPAGNEVFASEIPGGRVSWWGISPDGRTLAISRRQQTRPLKVRVEDRRTRLSLWDLPNNREIHGEDIDGEVIGADMSPDGSRVAWSLSLDRSKSGSEVRVWDAATGRGVWSRSDWGPRGDWFQPGRPEYSRDGRTLVVAGERWVGEQIYVLDAVSGTDRRPPLLNPDGTLSNLCLSEDGRRLFALARRDGTVPAQTQSVVVWDLVTGRKLLTLPVENVSAMTTDREGRRVFLMKEVSGTGKLELETLDGTPPADER